MTKSEVQRQRDIRHARSVVMPVRFARSSLKINNTTAPVTCRRLGRYYLVEKGAVLAIL